MRFLIRDKETQELLNIETIQLDNEMNIWKLFDYRKMKWYFPCEITIQMIDEVTGVGQLERRKKHE